MEDVRDNRLVSEDLLDDKEELLEQTGVSVLSHAPEIEAILKQYRSTVGRGLEDGTW